MESSERRTALRKLDRSSHIEWEGTFAPCRRRKPKRVASESTSIVGFQSVQSFATTGVGPQDAVAAWILVEAAVGHPRPVRVQRFLVPVSPAPTQYLFVRSEERRVGKECRS